MGPWWQHITPGEWLIAGLILLILEVFAPGAFLLWFGVAAVIVAAAVWVLPSLPWQLQIFAFAVLSIGLLLAFRKWRRTHPIEIGDQPLLNKRVQQHVGRIYVLEEAIANGRGKVKVGDALWTVEGPELPIGARVKVVGTREQVLVVEGVDREP